MSSVLKAVKGPNYHYLKWKWDLMASLDTDGTQKGCSYIYQDEQSNDYDYSNTYVSYAEYS